MKNKDRKVVVGGTFDIVHKGHKALLKKAFSLGKVTIGLTSDSFAQRSRKRKINGFLTRKRNLKKFVRENFSTDPLIVKISDKYGNTLNEDFDFIVVSPGSYPNAVLINRKRKNKGLKLIKIVKIKFVLGKNGRPISATDLAKEKNGSQ